LRNLIIGKSRGSVESFITLIPQVLIFLIMFQLVFMQFGFIKDTHTIQGELSKAAIKGGSEEYERYPLAGGGSVLMLSKNSAIEKFLDFNSISRKKIIAIAVDEDVNN